jgi:hypothetical protein
MRFLFFLLLVVNAAFAVHIWLTETRAPGEDPARREINREALRVVSVTDAASVAKSAARVNAARQLAENLNATACVELGGIKPDDEPRAAQAFAAMNLGNRVGERKAEEAPRYWVYLPPAKDIKAAETTMAFVKKLGVKDVSLLADKSISLGVFSTDDAAERYLAEVRDKGIKGALKAPRSGQVREHVFTVREPDTQLVARLTLMQTQFEGSALKAVNCQMETAQSSAVQGTKDQVQATPNNGAAKR